MKRLLKKLRIWRENKDKKPEAVMEVKILPSKREWLIEKDGKIEHIRR